MKSIDIITHCYAKKLPHYAYCLRLQIASILRYLPENFVRITVPCSASDELVMEEINKHSFVHPLYLEDDEFSHRALGRNKAALQTECDIVWFCDADYCFLGSVLDTLAKFDWPADVAMIYPEWIQFSISHENGDKMLLAAEQGNIPVDIIDPADFRVKRYWKAIGGVQIVQGDFAREHGYLKDTAWVEPNPIMSWLTRCDIAYRKYCLTMGKILPIKLPGVYRVRHSERSY